MGTDRHDVVIVGAGPVGLSLALGLARHGVRSIVLEKKPSPSKHSKALGILPRTMDIFRSWSILEPFLENGIFLNHVQACVVGSTKPFLDLSFAPLQGMTSAPGVLMMPQDKTERILLDLALASNSIDVRYGHEAIRFEEDADGVTLDIKGPQAPYRLTGTYLAGCDGPRSTVRQQLGWELEGKTYKARVLLADLRLDASHDALPNPRAMTDGNSAAAAVRFESGGWRLICPTPRGAPETPEADRELIHRTADTLFEGRPWSEEWLSAFRIHCRNSPHFQRGPIFLCGDAAHLNSPAGGQGMNSGIQDAHNLAWKLALVLDGGASPRLLQSYEAERRPAVIDNTDRITDFLTRHILLGAPGRRGLIFWLARQARSIPAVYQKMLQRTAMLDVVYRDSPVLSSSRLGGQICPNAEMGAPHGLTHLYNLLSGQLTLLVFDQDNQICSRFGELEGQCLRIVDSARRSVAICDPHSRLRHQLGLKDGAVVLVRPDGYIVWDQRLPTAGDAQQAIDRALGR